MLVYFLRALGPAFYQKRSIIIPSSLSLQQTSALLRRQNLADLRYTPRFFESDWIDGKPTLSAAGQQAVEDEVKRINAGKDMSSDVNMKDLKIGQ